jgi:hypothetical protein
MRMRANHNRAPSGSPRGSEKLVPEGYHESSPAIYCWEMCKSHGCPVRDSMKVAQYEVLGNRPKRPPSRGLSAIVRMTKEEGTIEPLSFRLQRNFASAEGDRSSLPGRTRFLPSPSNKLLGYFRDIPPGLILLGRAEVFSSGHDGPGA